MAAILHFKGDAIASDSSAAFAWEFEERHNGLVAVTLVGRNGRPRGNLVIRRVAELHRDDIALHKGLPVTSPARTLVDRAGRVGALTLENDLAEVRRRRLATDDEIRAAIDRVYKRRGVGKLRALLDGDLTPARTRSKYERKLLALIRAAELPAPRANDDVLGHQVDLHWREQRLIVEFDGWEFHRDRGAFETDRTRDARLVAAGYRVIRVTRSMIDRTPYAVVGRLASALAARPSQAA